MAPIEDLGDAIAEMETGTYRVRRPSAATVAKGRATPGAPTILAISGSLQPMSGRELQRLPEGMREKELLQFFTVVEMRSGDVLESGGYDWEVDRVFDFSQLGGYYRAVMTRAGPTPVVAAPSNPGPGL